MSSGFVSESDLAERRRIREELWKKNKKEGDPDEPPEEEIVYDHRSLYEKLQEQKDKKQEEYDEAHKLKNLVRGLENEEVEFLDFVDLKRKQEELKIKVEDEAALNEFRKRVNEVNQKAQEIEASMELKPDTRKSAAGSPKKSKSSQSKLLSGAVKRKSSESSKDLSPKNKRHEGEDSELPETHRDSGALRCVAILPGLGEYSDSSDSENDSNTDSDLEDTSRRLTRDLAGRPIQIVSQDNKQCCS